MGCHTMCHHHESARDWEAIREQTRESEDERSEDVEKTEPDEEPTVPAADD